MGVDARGPDREAAGHVAHVVEARNPPAFCSRSVYGARFVGAATGVDDVVRAAADGAVVPRVMQI